MHYSQIPSEERDQWSDAELSGAIWDEAVRRAGGYGFEVENVRALPFGYRAVLAEGSVRAHVEGDGLVTCIWNDDGVEMFELAAECHRQMGSEQLAATLLEVCRDVKAWQDSSGNTPRSFDHGAFGELPIGRYLEGMFRRVEEECAGGFEPMMAYLRAHPELF